MERIVASLQDLIDRNREGLSMLLRERYGITETITPSLLLAANQAFGDDFLFALSTLSTNNDLLHIEGDEPWYGGSTSGTTKPSLLDNLKGLFNSATKVATTVKSVTGKTTTAAAPEPASSSTKKILIWGIVIVVVLTIVALIIKNRS